MLDQQRGDQSTIISVGEPTSDLTRWSALVEGGAGPPLRVRGAARTHLGHVRERNEDAFLVLPDRHLFAVADGMGGHRAGDVASRVTIETLRARFGQPSTLTPHPERARQLVEALEESHWRIVRQSAADDALRGMGSTAVVVWLGGDGGLVAHVGDSRLYRLRDDVLERLTHDHSVAGDALREGYEGAEMLAEMGAGAALTRALGGDPEGDCEPELNCFDLRVGDTLLLCSDGLTDPVDEGRIATILGANAPAEAVAQMLVEEALDSGGPDNVTVVLAELEAAE